LGKFFAGWVVHSSLSQKYITISGSATGTKFECKCVDTCLIQCGEDLWNAGHVFFSSNFKPYFGDMLWLNLGVLNLGAGVIRRKRHVIERPGV
jgi:hypothetical protein